MWNKDVIPQKKEPDADIYRNTLLNEDEVLLSTATAVELYIVVTAKLGAGGILILNRLLSQSLFEIVPVDHQQMTAANLAFERYGKDRHPAKLNFGDLFSYALAKSRNLPLLFKGNDFSQTDIISA